MNKDTFWSWVCALLFAAAVIVITVTVAGVTR